MKSFVVLGAVLLATCLILQAKGDCVIDGETLSVGQHIRNCRQYTCDESGGISALACPETRCRNQIGYQDEDLSKPYPECCARPICASH